MLGIKSEGIVEVVALKALVIWGGILVLAVANGMLREFLLVSWFGISAATLLSGLILSTAIVAATYFFLPWLKVHRPVALGIVGVTWLFLTVVFEFLFGFWQGKSLTELLDAYCFEDGNIWPVVLAVTVFAPYIAGKLRKWF